MRERRKRKREKKKEKAITAYIAGMSRVLMCCSGTSGNFSSSVARGHLPVRLLVLLGAS